MFIFVAFCVIIWHACVQTQERCRLLESRSVTSGPKSETKINCPSLVAANQDSPERGQVVLVTAQRDETISPSGQGLIVEPHRKTRETVE